MHIIMYIHTQVAHMEVYDNYNQKLVKVLPMDDVKFTTKLTHYKLLPDDVDDHIKSLSTQAKKAEYFLKKVIKPALDIDDTDEFENLLTAMNECEYNHVKRLAGKIKSDLDKELKRNEVLYVCYVLAGCI